VIRVEELGGRTRLRAVSAESSQYKGSGVKIGVLQCDDVAEPLQAAHGNYPDMVCRWLGAADPRLEFQVWACHKGELPDARADVDAWVLGGSKHSVNDDEPWIHALTDFVRERWRRQQPLAGICFGHQMIARALGGSVAVDPHGWGVGIYSSRLAGREPWMSPWPGDTLNLLASHREQVQTLPESARLLAGSPFCPNYLMQVGDTVLGLQGHPEFSRSFAADLMTLRRGTLIPEIRVTAGLQSLFLPVHDQIMARWFLRFLRRAGRPARVAA